MVATVRSGRRTVRRPGAARRRPAARSPRGPGAGRCRAGPARPSARRTTWRSQTLSARVLGGVIIGCFSHSEIIPDVGESLSGVGVLDKAIRHLGASSKAGPLIARRAGSERTRCPRHCSPPGVGARGHRLVDRDDAAGGSCSGPLGAAGPGGRRGPGRSLVDVGRTRSSRTCETRPARAPSCTSAPAIPGSAWSPRVTPQPAHHRGRGRRPADGQGLGRRRCCGGGTGESLRPGWAQSVEERERGVASVSAPVVSGARSWRRCRCRDPSSGRAVSRAPATRGRSRPPRPRCRRCSADSQLSSGGQVALRVAGLSAGLPSAKRQAASSDGTNASTASTHARWSASTGKADGAWASIRPSPTGSGPATVRSDDVTTTPAGTSTSASPRTSVESTQGQTGLDERPGSLPLPLPLAHGDAARPLGQLLLWRRPSRGRGARTEGQTWPRRLLWPRRPAGPTSSVAPRISQPWRTGRGRLNQPAVAPPHKESDRAAHRVSDRDRRLDAHLGEECGSVIGTVLEAERHPALQAPSVPPVIESNHPVVLPQLRETAEPVERRRGGPPMQQVEGEAVRRGSPTLVVYRPSVTRPVSSTVCPAVGPGWVRPRPAA